MTPIQEAYALMQQQPESNIKIIVELLQRMVPTVKDADSLQPFRRTGRAKGLVIFPKDFDEHFDDLNEEISNEFSGGTT